MTELEKRCGYCGEPEDYDKIEKCDYCSDFVHEGECTDYHIQEEHPEKLEGDCDE